MGLSLKKILSPITKVLSWLMPDPPREKLPGAEITRAATDASIPKIYGSANKVSGTIIFKAVTDQPNDDIPNDLLHMVIVWSEAVESIDTVYIDDIDIESNSELFVQGESRYAYSINFVNGMVGYSDPLLTAAGWRTSDKCEGKAVSYIRLQYADGENKLRSEPQITADITGTVSRNPADHLLDYLTNPIYGKGESTSKIDLAAITAAGAVCDIQVEEVIGGGIYRSLFECNTILDTGEDVFNNLNVLLKSMRASMPVLDGKLTPIVEKDDLVKSIAIFEDDIFELDEWSNSNKSNS